MNYGGLTRDVSLVTVPTAFIDDYDVHLTHGSAFDPRSKELTGYVHVVDAPAGTQVTIDIPEAGAKATVQTNAEGSAAFTINLTLWSPESPKLYKVNLSSGSNSKPAMQSSTWPANGSRSFQRQSSLRPARKPRQTTPTVPARLTSCTSTAPPPLQLQNGMKQSPS